MLYLLPHGWGGPFNMIAFLAKDRNSNWNQFGFISKTTSTMNVQFYLKQPLTSPQHKIIHAYRTSKHSIIIPICRDNRLCCFCSYNVVGKETDFVLEHPSIRDMFLSLFQIVVLDNLRFFFQRDHPVDISLYFTEAAALYYSINWTFKPPSWFPSAPISCLELQNQSYSISL